MIVSVGLKVLFYNTVSLTPGFAVTAYRCSKHSDFKFAFAKQDFSTYWIITRHETVFSRLLELCLHIFAVLASIQLFYVTDIHKSVAHYITPYHLNPRRTRSGSRTRVSFNS